MDFLVDIAEKLEYAQNHGGILVSILLACIFIEIRIAGVERRSINADAHHELYYHHVELKQKKGE